MFSKNITILLYIEAFSTNATNKMLQIPLFFVMLFFIAIRF